MKRSKKTAMPGERQSPRLAQRKKLSPPNATVDLTDQSEEEPTVNEEVVPESIPIEQEEVVVTFPYKPPQTLPQLREAFLSRLKGQDTTLNKLSNIIYEFNAVSGEILSLLLAGISGTGKTSTIDILCSFYGMTRDSESFVYRDLSDIVKEEDITKLLGGAPSYLGYGEKNFVDDLLFASGNRGIVTTETITTTTTSRSRGRPPKNTQKKKFLISPDKKAPPPVIIVHFEELDKAHPSLLTVLINFLETGRLTSGNRKEFLLPKETKMILAFTANYGADEIAELSYLTDYYKAKNAIVEDMLDRGIERPLIGRFPHILPYFPLDLSVTKQMATESVSKLFETVEAQYRNYFTKFSFKKESETLLEKTLAIYTSRADPTLGMRSVQSVCHELRRDLCCETTKYIMDFLEPSGEKLPLVESPRLDVLLFSPDLMEERDYESIISKCQTKTTTHYLIENAWRARTNLVLILVEYKNLIMTSVVVEAKEEEKSEYINSNAMMIVPFSTINTSKKCCVSCGHFTKNFQRIRSPETVGSKIRMIFRIYCNLCISTPQLQRPLLL